MSSCGCDGDRMCFKHKIRTISMAPSTMPSRASHRPRGRSRDYKDNSNAWERGVKYDTMPDGTRVPFVTPSGSPIGLKQWVNEPKWRRAAARLDAARGQ